MSTSTPVSPQLIGQRYQRHERIGAGGMGTVYRGVDTQTGGEVAIKQLNAELVASTPELVERFVREGEALRRLNHPNIVKMLDSVQETDGHYLVMELVRGGALEARLQAHPDGLPVVDVLRIALELADALTRAHHLNIIHRDLKPANVLLAEDGTPRLTDFGIAYMIERDRVTEDDAIVGTLSYLSPEALNGERVDGRADIWAFGVMLCEMLTGQHPFERENMGGVLLAIVSEPPPDFETQHPDLPIGLIDLLYRMLEKDREARIPSIRQVGALLEGILRGIDTSEMQAVRPISGTSPTITYENGFDTPTPTIHAIRHNLPHQPTPFVGRETEIAELLRLLADQNARLITILAPGGMGKTRLALEVAEQFFQRAADSPRLQHGLHGVYFVNLAPLTDPGLVVGTIAEAVGFQFYPGGEPKQQLLDYLREKTMLLILDNFEHLLNGVEIVSEILETAAGVRLLATSRQRLNLRGETLYTLDGMDFPDWETPEDALQYSAVKLFMGSARRVYPGFDLQADDLRYVARICRLVQGMPLGIELAASWIDALTLGEIADEIGKSLDFLETDLRDMPERHRSLRAVFDYSWNLLTNDERKIFAPMAVFHGGFSREAANVVVGANLRQLTALVNKSLLKRDPESGDYSVHEMLRQYADEQLESSGQAETFRTAHSRYYLEALIGRTADLEGRDQLGAFRIGDREAENGRMAWLWALQHQEFDLIGRAIYPLYIQMFLRGQHQDGINAFGAAVEILRQAPASPERDLVLADALARYAYFAAEFGNQEACEAALAECEALLAHIESPQIRAAWNVSQGNLHLTHRIVPDASPFIEAALAHYQRPDHDQRWNLMNALLMAANICYFRLNPGMRRLDDAARFVEEAERLQGQLGGIVNHARILYLKSTIAAYQKRYDIATQILHEVLNIMRLIGNSRSIANILNNLGVILGNIGNWTEAQRYYEESYQICIELGHTPQIILVLGNLGDTALALGEFVLAKQYFQRRADIKRRGHVLKGLGYIAYAHGEYSEAENFFLEAYELFGSRDRKSEGIAYYCRWLGRIALETGRFEDARRSIQEGLNLMAGREIGETSAYLHLEFGKLEYRMGNLHEAEMYLTQSLDELREIERHFAVDNEELAFALAEIHKVIGDIRRHQNRLAEAGEQLREALQHARSMNLIVPTMGVLAGIADLSAAQGENERAVELAAFVAHNRRAFAVDRRRADRTLESLRSALSNDDYNAAVERGQLAELEAVVKLIQDALAG